MSKKGLLPKDNMVKTTGILTYSPLRRQQKNVEFWATIELNRDHTGVGGPNDIGRYLRWWVDHELLNKTHEPGFGLHAPSNGVHISVIRGLNDVAGVPSDPYGHKIDRERLQTLWGKYEGRQVGFWYSLEPKVARAKDGGSHWYVEVECHFANQVRKELRLPAEWKYHMTFGRLFG